MTRRELMRRVGRLEQVAGVRLVSLGDGVERGVRVLEFRTGTGFSFDVLVDRSMDVGRCELRGQSLAWLSPTGVVGPWYSEPMGLGWFRSWGGGMVVTCGLDHTLLGGVDDASQFHQLVRPTEEYGLHGRIGFIPARLTGYGERWEGDECVLYAEGVVRQAAVFGEAIELRRRIEARMGESRFTIHDELTNVGFDPTTHMYLYHVNRKDQFPFHTMWRMLGEGIYGVAMEPTTNRDAGRFDARERGELGYIGPQESRGYDLEIGALDGADAIDAFAQRVEAVTEPQTKQGSKFHA